MRLDLLRVSPSGFAGLVFALFAFWVIPQIAGSLWLNVFTSTACFALAAAGVSFMYARLGMVSLTQVGLMGIGGWVMLRVSYAFALPFEISLLLAGVVTMLCGMLLALPALRLRGLYLALVTLMAAGGLEIVFATFQFPNGGTGFWGVQTGLSNGFERPVWAISDAAYLRYTVLVATLGFLLIEIVSRLNPGRAWALIRRSEAAAMASGVNVTRYKTAAFALSGLLGGLSGALLAGSLGLLDGQTFRASESVLLFALAVVGGARFWLGAIIAAALFRILPALLNNWGVDADLSFVIFGVGLLHAVITAPHGIAGQIHAAIAQRFVRYTRDSPVSLQVASMRNLPAVKSLNTQIKVENVSVRFGGVVALDNVSAKFTQQVSGIIGPNGAGKTTLMNVFSGFVALDQGSIKINNEALANLEPHARSNWGLRRSFQKEEIAEDLSVADNVRVQLDGQLMSASSKRQAVDQAIGIVGLAHKAHVFGGELNNFERRLTDVAKCIVGEPKLILFDEPAGGLSIEETRQLGDLILNIHKITGAQVLVIDHDVELIARICVETLVLDFGRTIAFGPTSEVLSDPLVKAAYLGTENINT